MNKVILLSRLLDGMSILNFDDKYILLRSYKLYNPSNHIYETHIDKGVDVTELLKIPIETQSGESIKTKIADMPEINLTLSQGITFNIIKCLTY